MDLSSSKNKEIRWWDFVSAFLLISLVLISASRLVAAKWVANLSLVQNVAVFAVLAGLALGQSKFSRWVVLTFALIYGIYVIPWQLGMTMGEDIVWRERIFSMVGRIQVILRDIFAQRDVRDNLFFLLLMALLYWALGVYSGYQLTRNANIWRVILPAGFVAFIFHAFDHLFDNRAWYIFIYIFTALLLLARVNYLRQRKKWEIERTHIPSDVGFDLGRIALIIALVIVFIAWNAPIFTSTLSGFAELYGNINRPWLSLKDRMSFMFASLRASVGLVSDSFGNSERLGLGSERSNSIIMTVEGPKYPFLGARYYWRARVYDEYSNGVWTTNLLERRTFAPDKDYFKQAPVSGRYDAVFRITPYTAIGELFLPSQPTWVSRPGQVQFGTLEGGLIDMVAFQAVPYIRPGEYYEARSNLTSFTKLQLRNSPAQYPQWILDRYLQLPENITPRTRELAQQITQGYENPYDKAEAITQYLRNNIQYQTTIDPPPDNQEVIDWFLFDYKKGFCNYYATAQIILLRSLGIPARWAVGYAEGERIVTEEERIRPQLEETLPESTSMDISTWNVRQKDSHAWPEVYFTGIGWVEFEPTTSQVDIFRPEGQSGDPSAERGPAPDRDLPAMEPTPEILDKDSERDDEQSEEANAASGRIYFGIVLILIGAALLFVYQVRNKESRLGIWWQKFTQDVSVPFPVQVDRSLRRMGVQPPQFVQRWSNYVLLPALGRAYQEINRALRRLRKLPGENATPAERTAILVENLSQSDRAAYNLLKEYEKGTYSLHSADINAARLAGNEIHKLSLRARLQALFFGNPEARKQNK